jgi:uncharacterized protein
MGEPKLYALITGASMGFGKELAEELASRNINLLLVSLPNEGLEQLCKELVYKHHINAFYYETDLSKNQSVYDLANWAIPNYRINILINNAGIGCSRQFEHTSFEFLETMIQINIRAVTLLTRLLLPEIRSHKKGYILNVSSMASFSPMAYKAIYPASKSFIYSFSHSLNHELKGTGVSVSVIHPGPMKTNPEVTSRIEGQSYIARLGLISPKKVARIAIQGLFEKQSQIVPGIYNKLFWLMMKVIPLNFRLYMVSGIMKSEAEKEQLKMIAVRQSEIHKKAIE